MWSTQLVSSKETSWVLNCVVVNNQFMQSRFSSIVLCFYRSALFLNVVCLIKQLGRSAVTRGCGPETTPSLRPPPLTSSCLVRMLNVTGKMNLYLMLSRVASLHPMFVYFLLTYFTCFPSIKNWTLSIFTFSGGFDVIQAKVSFLGRHYYSLIVKSYHHTKNVITKLSQALSYVTLHQ